MFPVPKIRPVRNGAAVVELAICLPFVFLLTAGAIELSAGLHQQMYVRSAVHQCANHACNGPTTSNQIRTVAQQIMSTIEVTSFTITIDVIPRTVNASSVEPPTVTHFLIPSTGAATAGLDEVPRGTILRLRLVAPRPPTVGLTNFLNSQISAECFFVKER